MAARSIARKSSAKDIPVIEAKRRVLDAIAQGAKVAEACAMVGRSPETYRDWQKSDPEFKAELAELRAARAGMADEGPQVVPDFETFCRDYLHEPLFPHQLRWVDILEGRAPRDLEPGMVYEPGDNSRVLFNVPPNHAKTVTLSINYVTWRIHKDPNVKIAVISKSQGFAQKVLAGVKMRLTNNSYRDMHLKFAPDGGWRDPDQSWTQKMIYVQGKGDGEKDPTVEAIGLGGQIYGGRFDVIICDDIIDNENFHRWEDHVDWVTTILDSRLPPVDGLLMVIGTRIGATDVYSELRKLRDEDDEQFFTYFSQPAVIDYADGRSENWRTLWPWTNLNAGDSDNDPKVQRRCAVCYLREHDCSCVEPRLMLLKPRWPGKPLAKKRFPMGERRWSLVYQQQQIPADATFNQHAVATSINRLRRPMPMLAANVGHRQTGMSGLYVIGGLDPATVGSTAMMVTGLDRVTETRWVLDGVNAPGMSPASMRSEVKRLTDAYRINEWVIERNAFQRFLTQDPELTSFLQSRGCRLTEHYTTANKVDPDFGVMSLAPLFESTGKPQANNQGGKWTRVQEGDLIELPDDRESAVITELVKQLIFWEPSGLAQNQKTDLVMALWFCEIAAKRILGHNRKTPTHLANPYAARGRLKQRGSVNLQALRQAQFDSERKAV